jgi:hypothetical protein
MAVGKIVQTTGAYLLFALVILGFAALLVFAGLLLRHNFFPNGTTPKAESGPAKRASTIAGHYSGYTTLQTGICSLGVHEFAIDVDENGNARSNYAMKDGKFLTGTIAPNGKVKLAFRENGVTILFNGEIQDGHITGTSSASADRTCSIYWDLAKN